MNIRCDRRDFLRAAFAGACAAGVAPRAFAAAPRATNGRKLLTVFLRGGNDALNTLVPAHDADYWLATTRPTLAIPQASLLDLGLGGPAFHPALAKLKVVHDLGALATIHRVGYPDPTLSHFAGQQYWETAVPGDVAFIEGWVARWADAAGGASPIPAVSVSPQLMRMFSGAHVLPHVPDLAKYELGADAASTKLMSGAQGLFGTPASGAAYDALVKETGGALGSTLALLEQLPPWTPQPGSFPKTMQELAAQGLPQEDWALEFFRELEDALHILKDTDCAIAGVEMPGFDHHSNQGALTGPHADRLAVLAHGVRSVWIETAGGLWNQLVCLVQSEFGRASAENGSLGTDHGEAGLVFAAGGPVIGGVYHCDPGSWPSGTMLFASQGKYVEHARDFRAVLGEVLERHLLLPVAQLDAVVPGWSSLTGPTFQPLGFLA